MEPSHEIKIGIWRHFKGGIYKVLQIATHSETEEKMVVYQNCASGQWWVRPAAMWNEKVERDGQIYLRFTYLGDGDDINREE